LHESDAPQRRKRNLSRAAAAALGFVMSTIGWLLLFSYAPSGVPESKLRTELDLRPYDLMRREPQPSDRKPLKLPRARVMLTMLLPVGSEPGPYDVQVLDSQLASRASATGRADLRNEVAALQATLDLEPLSPGAYQLLAIRRSGQEWQMFPAQVQ
jgi:hypothetical protein